MVSHSSSGGAYSWWYIFKDNVLGMLETSRKEIQQMFYLTIRATGGNIVKGSFIRLSALHREWNNMVSLPEFAEYQYIKLLLV
jgi:hypothetical protein